MVTDALLDFISGAVSWFFGILPAPDVPDWAPQIQSTMATLFSGANLGAWFPFGLAGGVLLMVASAWLIGFSIKLLRIVASFLTAGGGSAA